MMRYEKHITRTMLKDEPRALFVFGDNMIGQGYGGQAKEMRGEPNAVGVPTKNYPGLKPPDYFSDDDFTLAKAKIDIAFGRLFQHAAAGGTVVWPLNGIGSGFADLERKAPKIWEYIEEKRKTLLQISQK